jgi:branched-chain amino acid transport system permease protein
VGIVVGGLASIPGAIFGALFIQFVPNYAQEISKAAPWAIYGVFLIAFMYAMPDGVAGFLRRLARRAESRAPSAPPAAPATPKGGHHAHT